MSDHAPGIPVCDQCGQQHITASRPTGHQACAGHLSKHSGQKGGPLTPCSKHPIRGADVCRSHGAGAPQVRAAADRRLAMAAAARELAVLGEPIAVDPAAALLSLVHHKAGEVAWLRAMVQTDDLDGLVWGLTRVKEGGDDQGTTHEAKPSIWWSMLRTAEDQLATYAAAAIKAGVEERRVRLEEQKGQLVAGVIRRILARLDLTPAQLELVPVVVPGELRALTEEA